MHAIHEQITVAGPEIVGVRLPQAAYAYGRSRRASSTQGGLGAVNRTSVLARPTGSARERGVHGDAVQPGFDGYVPLNDAF